MKESSRKESGEKNSKNGSPKDWFEKISTDKVIGNAQRIITKAVDVLEEEIAAGILAAKKLESKVIDVDEMRDANRGELMSRIRRDTHEAIDIILDAVSVVTRHIGTLSETLAREKETKTPGKTDTQIPVVKNEEPARAGYPVDIQLMLNNDSRDTEKQIKFVKTDLICPQGNKILSRYIQLTPPAFTLLPGGKKELGIKVKIPLSCKSGTYSGLFRDTLDPELRIVVSITIQ